MSNTFYTRIISAYTKKSCISFGLFMPLTMYYTM